MAESFSVKAILSASDKGFTSAMNAASKSVSNLKSTVSSGLGFGILAGVGQSAFNAITGSVSSLVSELNSSSAAWKTFQANMEMNGHAADEIERTKNELRKFAEQTIYSSSDMASTFAQLDAVGTKSTLELVKGFGGLAAAAENPAQAMKTLSQQATQAAAKPYIQWADFKLMLEQTPAGMSAVAKEMGMSMSELVLAVQDGTIATEDFFDAIAKVGTNEAFTKLATQYKTVDQAMDGLTETIGNKLSPAFDVLSQRGIDAISKIVDSMGQLDGEKIAGKLTSFLDKAGKYWDILKTNAIEVKDAFGSAFKAIGEDLLELNGAFGSTESIKSFSDVIGTAKDALVTFAGFLEENSDIIAKVITQLPKLIIAYKGFKILTSITPLVSAFSSAVLSLGGSIVSKIGTNLFGISKGQEAVGKSSGTSAKKMLNSAKAFAMLGAGVLLVSTGFYLLAQSAVSVADSGGAAIAVLAGMVVAVTALSLGMTAMIKSVSATPARLKSLSVAFVALGASILMVSAGFYVLSQSAINLANAGAPAIAIMVGMVAAVALLAAGAAALGPALTAGAIGFVAFGAAILMVSAGALIASAALTVVASVLPTVSEYGLQGAVAIAALGVSMVVFAAGATAAGAASLVLGAGLLVVGAAVLVASAGVLALAAGSLVLGAGLAVVSAAVTVVAAALPAVATGALAGSAAFTALLASATGVSAIMLVLTASLVALTVAETTSTVGMVAFSASILAGTVGVTAMAAALALVNSSMKSVSTNAKTAQKSISSMKESLSIVNEGLDALGNKAKSAVNKLISTFSNSAGKARSAGKTVGDSINNGVKSGLDQLPPTAQSIMSRFNSAISSGGSMAVATSRIMASSIVSALNSAQSGAYSAGYNIGAGLARGMSASLGEVRSMAAQLAAAAEQAIRAKAQIHSPSRVTDKLGQYFGSGWVGGILDKVKDSKKAVKELVQVPSLPKTPDLAYSYGYSGSDLNDEYIYTKNAKYTIVVPVQIDGKETARVTAPYTEAELSKREKINNMINGKR